MDIHGILHNNASPVTAQGRPALPSSSFGSSPEALSSPLASMVFPKSAATAMDLDLITSPSAPATGLMAQNGIPRHSSEFDAANSFRGQERSGIDPLQPGRPGLGSEYLPTHSEPSRIGGGGHDDDHPLPLLQPKLNIASLLTHSDRSLKTADPKPPYPDPATTAWPLHQRNASPCRQSPDRGPGLHPDAERSDAMQTDSPRSQHSPSRDRLDQDRPLSSSSAPSSALNPRGSVDSRQPPPSTIPRRLSSDGLSIKTATLHCSPPKKRLSKQFTDPSLRGDSGENGSLPSPTKSAVDLETQSPPILGADRGVDADAAKPMGTAADAGWGSIKHESTQDGPQPAAKVEMSKRKSNRVSAGYRCSA
ncbi:uncharacterized protein BJ171DRAFT_214089 [Polychytrium aggregatum]|uniref:uncharacterized protein n=1 Tax=Polychytrium aggregatum TaxID=110093 RepID=UPI0022FDF036|nr:uncharacterized protein BJ171DRAFT_214089 [Polychytrium aggregatum]KAI9199438.1 hypothetical protein BJ171DRAFT_214089 [Polychytrium aggregatum]